MLYSAFIMKKTVLFIIFSLLCSFSLTYAMPSCEEAWTPKKLTLSIRAKIILKMSMKRARLRRMDLQGQNLSNMNFEKADLREADLREADLTETYFWQANLYQVDLRGAKLDGTNFYQANLYGAKVTKEQAEYLNGKGLIGFVVME